MTRDAASVSLATVVLLAAFQAVFALFLAFDWGHGFVRGLLLLVVLVGLIALRFSNPLRRWRESDRRRLSSGVLRVLLLTGLALNVAIAGYTIDRSVRQGRIPFDQGQMTWRSARMLWRGQDPYGAGALIDDYNFSIRSSLREQAGIAPRLPTSEVPDALHRYDATLDPQLRAALLPDPGGTTSDLARREASVLGYKYGPVPLLAAAALVWTGLPASVVMLNVAVCFATLFGFYALYRDIGGGGAAMAGLLALLLDRHISWNYLNNTAMDVWALLFLVMVVLCFRRCKNALMGAALALAVASKLFPSLAFLPLLLFRRGSSAGLTFVAVLVPLMLPWLLWDASGFVSNSIVFSTLALHDTTSWLSFLPADVGTLVTGVAAGVALWLWWRLWQGQERRFFWVLAMVNVLLLIAGPLLHNNYLPWATVWIVAAVLEWDQESGSQTLRQRG